jgi:phenylalanyl-tRNA synthetase alpha chain
MAEEKQKNPKSSSKSPVGDRTSKDDWTKKGHYHPLTIVTREIQKIFSEMGFSVATGPEIETENYHFDFLNIPKDHPARDMWDTFWLEPRKMGKILRAQTSPVQIRYMEENNVPLAIIAPGKTYRYEATDATHEAVFHQVEGLMVGENISLANLKATLGDFFEKFFGEKKEIRLRPSYFPFVEPGLEVDIRNFGEKKWLEVLGAGQVHPKVLLNAGVDSERYQGFAFGMGVERLTMLKYDINDIRLFNSGDLRLTNQF